MWICPTAEVFRNCCSFKTTLRTTKFDGLNTDRVMFSGNSRSTKKLHLPYDRYNEHYNLITNLKGVMAKQFICNGCDTLYDFTHKCDKVYSLCTAAPPCTKDQTKYFITCNRRFVSGNNYAEIVVIS